MRKNLFLALILTLFSFTFGNFALAQVNRCGGGVISIPQQPNEPKPRGCLRAHAVVEALTDPKQIEAISTELRNLGGEAVKKSCRPTADAHAVEVSGQICDGQAGKTCYFVTMLDCKYKNKGFPMAMQGGCRSEFCQSFSACMSDEKVDTNIVAFSDAPKPTAEEEVSINPATGVLEIRR